MKYTIEDNGTAKRVSSWTPRFAAECGLAGASKAPTVPYVLKDGRTLREVRILKGSPTKFQYMTSGEGSLVGDVWELDYVISDMSIEQVRSILLQEVSNIRNIATEAGITWSPDEGVTIYHVDSDKNSRYEMTAAIQAMDYVDQVEQAWRMQDNTFVVLSIGKFKEMGLAIRSHVNACYVRQAQLEYQIGSLDLADLLTLDVTTGWPGNS